MKREAAISLSIAALSLAFFLPEGVRSEYNEARQSAQDTTSTAGQERSHADGARGSHSREEHRRAEGEAGPAV